MNMKAIWCAMGILITSSICAEIKEVHDFNQIEETILPSLSSRDWVLLDIDYTLTEPAHPALQMAFIKQNKQRFRNELSKFSEKQKDLVPVLMVTNGPNKLTDPNVNDLFQKLRARGNPVLGLTAADTSVIPDVGSIPEWRQRELKRLGIDFTTSSSALLLERIEFSQFTPFRGTYPLYQDGILYCNVISPKGEVLSALLNYVTEVPARIIFIDDTLENLQNVEMEMQKRGISFLGLHYKITTTNTETCTTAEWNNIWENVHKRADRADILEGYLQTGKVIAIDWATQSMPPDSLIIFDVGNVLLSHRDAVLGYKYRTWIKEWVQREAPQLKKEDWKILSAIIDRDAEIALVNPSLPSIINTGKQHATVLALSKFWCGSLDDKTTFEEHRLEILKKVGIEFEEPFPHLAGWHHVEMEATYSKGLIQTEAPLKGPVLEAFLHDAGWKPKALLFVDDRKDQCDSIAATAKALGIPALCIQYMEAIEQTLPLDISVADKQFHTLLNERRWISDEMARQKSH